MITDEQIKSLAEKGLEGSSSYLLDLKIRPGNNIQVIIDSDNNISISDCVKLSRFIESRLDREVEDFELQVTSAGIDTPLRLVRQYRKNIGRDLDIELKEEKIKGTLTEVFEDHIVIIPVGVKSKTKTAIEPKEINYSEIKRAKIIIKF